MNHETYFFEKMPREIYYRFKSRGPKGEIPKIVRLSWADEKQYILSFGDKDGAASQFNDLIRTNNNDCRKVLATVAVTAIDFLSMYHGVSIFAEGSTESRTRLYQRHIAAILDQIDGRFIVLGRRNSLWEPFCRGVNYDAFMLTRRPGFPVFG